MPTIAAQQITVSGLEATYTAAASSQTFDNDGTVFLHVKNGDGSDHDITLTTAGTVAGLAIADATITVTAGEERLIGRFPQGAFNDGNGQVAITWSATTSMTFAVLKF